MHLESTRPSKKDPENKLYIFSLSFDDLYIIKMMAFELLHTIPKGIPELEATRRRVLRMFTETSKLLPDWKKEKKKNPR